MTDISLTPITSGYNLSRLNDNFSEVEDVINGEVLHTTGGNNFMSQQLGMGNNKIINLGRGEDNTDGVNLEQVLEIANSGVGVVSAGLVWESVFSDFTLEAANVGRMVSMDNVGPPVVFTCVVPVPSAVTVDNAIIGIYGNGDTDWVLDYTATSIVSGGILDDESNTTQTFPAETFVVLQKQGAVGTWTIIYASAILVGLPVLEGTDVVFSDVIVERPSSSTAAELSLRNQDGGTLLNTNSGSTTLFNTDSAGSSLKAIITHNGSEVNLFSPAGITPGLKITGDQTQEVLRASGFEPIAAENTSARFSELQVVDQTALAIATFKVRNEDGGLVLTASDDVAKLQRTNTAGTTISDFIFQNASETRLHAPGMVTTTLLLDGEESQKVRRSGADHLIAAEGTSPNFDGASFNAQVIIDIPSPDPGRLDVRNDEGGTVVHADNGTASVRRTLANGSITAGSMIAQSSAVTTIGAPDDATPSIRIESLDVQKVRRAGVDQLIAAENTNPTFDGAVFTSSVFIDKPGTDDSSVNIRNDEGGMALRANNDTATIVRTDSVGSIELGPVVYQDAFRTNLFRPGSDTAQITLDGDDSQKVRRAGVDELIAAENTNPTFDGAVFTSSVFIDKPGINDASLSIRNDEGGMSLRANNDTATLVRTDSVGTIELGPVIYQDAFRTNLFRPGSDTAQVTLDGDDSQKVRRSGVDQLIAAENTNPTFAGALLTDDLVIDAPTTDEAKLDLRNDEIGLSIRVNGSAVVLWRTDAAGVENTGPLISQGSLETNFFWPGSNTGQILLDGDDSQKIRRGGVHRQIASLDDVPTAALDNVTVARSLAVADFAIGNILYTQGTTLTLDGTVLGSVLAGAECVVIVDGATGTVAPIGGADLIHLDGTAGLTTGTATLAAFGRYVITKTDGANQYGISGAGIS